MKPFAAVLWGLLGISIHASQAAAFDGSDPDTWSSAFERAVASRWQAGDKPLDPGADRQFVIVCDPANGGYIRGLNHLRALREEFSRDRQAWDDGRGRQYSCIGRNSFRLDAHPEGPTASPDAEDDPGAHSAAYKVVRDDGRSQIIELRFRDLNTGIYDSFFKYEVRGGDVIPLESWVVGRGLIAVLVTEAVVAALLLLAGFGVFRLLRRRAGRARKSAKQE